MGLAAAANGVVAGTGLADAPALFLAVAVIGASSLGVVLRRRLAPRVT